MARLVRSFSKTSNSSSSSTSSTSTTTRFAKNKEVINIENIEQDLANWNVPKVGTSQVYNKGSFLFKSNYIIKIVEETYPLAKESLDLSLLSQGLIDQYREMYNYLHIGLVQIAIKPLTRERLNNSVLICVRDKRHNRIKDSILGCIESSLSSGPIYFNCFPNFSVCFKDANVLKCLKVDVQTHGFDMEEGTSNIALIYSVYFKVMNTICPYINLKSLIRDKKKEKPCYFKQIVKRPN